MKKPQGYRYFLPKFVKKGDDVSDHSVESYLDLQNGKRACSNYYYVPLRYWDKTYKVHRSPYLDKEQAIEYLEERKSELGKIIFRSVLIRKEIKTLEKLLNKKTK